MNIRQFGGVYFFGGGILSLCDVYLGRGGWGGGSSH